MFRGIAAAGAAAVLLAAAPAPRLDPLPSGSQTVLVHRYLDALAAKRYGDAYALLDAPARAYFRSAANFASGFDADAFSLASYTLTGSRGDARFRLYFAREHVRLRDPGRDAIGAATITAPYGVAGTGARATIKDLGRPWRAFASRAATTRDGLRVRVNKVSMYARAIAVVVTFANVGDGYITLLPYGRSVLRDDAGNVYRLIDRIGSDRVDPRLVLGVHLAADAQITGVLSFASPGLDDSARRFTLTVGPSVRAGADAPLNVDVPGIAPA